jgi:DNA gyrase subunit A
MGLQGVKNAYMTGRGSVTMRAKTNVEDIKGKRQAIIISEIPYQLNKTRLIEQLAEGIRSKKITGVSDLRDESDRSGMRVVLELQSHTNVQITMNQLFKHSSLQMNFGIIILALVDGVPRILSLKECLNHYVNHRFEVVERRTKFDLRKAKEREHILEGLKIALDHLDEVIKTIRASKDGAEAKKALAEKFKLSDIQAQAILDMRLQRLTGLERQKIIDELQQIKKLIKELEEILKDKKKVYEIIKKELLFVKEKYSDKRRTQIKAEERLDFEIEELIPQEKMIITVTNSGYIKRIPEDTYRIQNRGGRGVSGVNLKEEDYLDQLIATTTHHSILFFTSQAKVYKIMAHEIPEASRIAKGTNIINLLQMSKYEKVTAVIPVKDFSETKNLVMATKKGIVNKSELKMYSNIRKTGIFALNLDEGDELVDVRLTSGDSRMVLITNNGMSISFNETEIRTTGRKTRGVRGIKLSANDRVVSMLQIMDEKEILVVTQFGYGKRTDVGEYKTQARAGKGIKTIKITEKNGPVVAAKGVNKDDEIILISKNGTIIRIKVNQISVLGRATQGVKLMKLEGSDEVITISLTSKDDEEIIEPEAKV